MCENNNNNAVNGQFYMSLQFNPTMIKRQYKKKPLTTNRRQTNSFGRDRKPKVFVNRTN